MIAARVTNFNRSDHCGPVREDGPVTNDLTSSSGSTFGSDYTVSAAGGRLAANGSALSPADGVTSATSR